MSKSLLAIIGVVGAIVAYAISTYNGFIPLDENVKKAWGNVEASYQKRFDLVPNLVETVKAYAKHEKGTFEAVTQARANATKAIQINIDDMDEEEMQKKLKQINEANAQLNQGLGRLMATAEAYPELKANTNFIKLQEDLEKIENEIANARRIFNEAVQTYNTEVRVFPANIVANIFGFRSKAMFEAEAGADKAVKVNFD
ncbi:MAG: LemA family protein [Paludibacteraceae bacterium]|nr:LemA family protein [Candidatus Physcocola equi]MCQ2234919.1 LemA family protein [Paludibacteraceae bacterium]